MSGVNGSALAFRPTQYQVVRKLTENIDAEIAARPWANKTLTQAQDVRAWIDDPSQIDARIGAQLERFASLLAPGARVLDVGCFGGYCFDWLRTRVPGLTYVGVDVLEEVVAAAANAHPDDMACEFFTGDLFDLDDTENLHGPFDAALCLRVVVHTPWLDRALAQLASAAPVSLVGLRTAPRDEAEERMDTVSGERHFFRRYSLRTIEAAIPKGCSYDLHNDGAYESLVLRRA